VDAVIYVVSRGGPKLHVFDVIVLKYSTKSIHYGGTAPVMKTANTERAPVGE